ncbi:hypothetical protein [Altibacter sp. HG106]|uniref:hypothetical protein n=1 Tax=Altibacter sp. HG106 TaxID=3023937 RepID=UPI002350B6F7|nr:hypothetical protein [Altibacter sp. HG106]MDC7993803.1 hypothetical protein [Altibacter sp. HG106]
MKTVLFTLLCITPLLSWSQDYFSIVQRNGSVERNYPKNVIMRVISEDGTKTAMSGVEAFEVTGNQALEIEVPWRDAPEVLQAKGDTLAVFVLPADRWNTASYNKRMTRTTYPENTSESESAKPTLTFKEVMQDENVRLYGFSNGITVRFDNSTVRAWQDGTELKVTNRYLIYGTDYLLKLSVDPEREDTWYVFEPYNH